MTEEDMRNLDIGISMAISTMVEAMGMHWENVYRQNCGTQIAYDEKAFNDLLERNGIHWNAVLGRYTK